MALLYQVEPPAAAEASFASLMDDEDEYDEFEDEFLVEGEEGEQHSQPGRQAGRQEEQQSPC
jgi:hypothetical protein